jgi:predicted  nucleic acid-binding Zn-ribbon protein
MASKEMEQFKKKLSTLKNLPESYQAELNSFRNWLDSQTNITWKDAADRFSAAISSAEKNLETIDEVSDLSENSRRRLNLENELSKLQNSLIEMERNLENLKAERDQSLQIFEKIKNMPVPGNAH